MKNPASDISRLPSSRKRRRGHKTTPPPSPVEAIWNELCSWMVSQTLRKTSKTRQETDFRLLPALLEHFWGKDFPCPAPFLQALTVRLMQHGPFQRWPKEDPRLRKRLFSALLRLDAGRGLVVPFVEACLPHENDPEALAGLIESWPPGLLCPETIWQQWCEKTRPPVNADDGDQRKLRQRAWQALFQLDPERGLVLPFVEACLPHENHPEVLSALIESWPPGLVCPETIWQQWCEKTRPPVSAGEDDGSQQELRQLAWQALFQLPAPERDPTGSPRWLSFLRQQLKFETSPRVLKSIWDSLNQLGTWPTSNEERTAWLAELERHSPCDSKASDRFVTRDAPLREAIIWRVLFGMHVPADKTAPSVLSKELLSRYLSDYLKTPSCLLDGNERSRLLKTMAMLPAMEHDRRAWLDTWEKTGAMTAVSSVSREAFWEVMVRAQEAGLYPAEETMEAAIQALGSEKDFPVFRAAASWAPPAGRLQKLWSDLWDPHLFSTLLYTVWKAWRPATDGYETFCSRLMEPPREFRRMAARHMLTCYRTEMKEERWHAWWARWVRQESDLEILSELSWAMRDWQPLPEVILSAWRERGQSGERDAEVRRLAWWVLASQPVDLSQDIICHLPCETDPIVLKYMARCSPAATPVPAAFWKGWGQKFATLPPWEQQAEDIISQAIRYDYWRTTAHPEGEDGLRSFQWICEQSPARGQGLLPGWNTLRPMLEEGSVSPEVELFFFSLVRKWGSPEGWQAWWEMAAAIEKNRDHFVIPGGCCGMIRRVYLVERLAAGLSSCGEQADETTLRRLSRQIKQQWSQAEDVKLWQWLGELLEKAGVAGEGRSFRQTGSAVLSDRIWPLGSGLPAWESRSTPGQVSDFPPARPASLSLT